MFIELAELIRCPGPHDETVCVLAPDIMDGRRVVSGMLGCPECKAEYHIAEGIVGFGEDPLLGGGSRSDDLTVEELPQVDHIQALLALSSPGGYVALIGSAVRLADGLAELAGEIRFIGVNPPPGLQEAEYLSLLRSPVRIPLTDSCVRGVVLGKEYLRNRWMIEGGRILKSAGRLVAVSDLPSAPGVKQLAASDGLWVGEKE